MVIKNINEIPYCKIHCLTNNIIKTITDSYYNILAFSYFFSPLFLLPLFPLPPSSFLLHSFPSWLVTYQH